MDGARYIITEDDFWSLESYVPHLNGDEYEWQCFRELLEGYAYEEPSPKRCWYGPDVVQTFYDDDDCEWEPSIPVANEQSNEDYSCSNCGGYMIWEWFDTEPFMFRADGVSFAGGYTYTPRFDFCPYCGCKLDKPDWDKIYMRRAD